MDIFSVFDKTHAIYTKLQQDDPAVDVSLPSFKEDSSELVMSIKVTPGKDAKIHTLEGSSPCQLFGQLSKRLQGTAAYVKEKLVYYINSVAALRVSLYKQFADALDKMFFGKPPLIDKFVTGFGGCLAQYFELAALSENELQVTVKLNYPARISVYWQDKNVAMSYSVSDRLLVFSGFCEPQRVMAKEQSEKLGVPIDNIKVQEVVVSETAPARAILNYPSLAGKLLVEMDQTRETSDEILGHVIQKLILMDVLDGLQDVVFDDDGGALFLCFDPVMSKDEMLAIENQLKQTYPQTMLSDVPSEHCSWWVITIGKISDTASQVAVAGTGPAPSGPGVIAKTGKDPLSAIAKEVDTEAALDAVSK